MDEEDVFAALKSTDPVLVFVHGSNWPDMAVVWDEVHAGYRGGVKMMKIDITTAPTLDLAYGIKYFPTYLSNRGRCIGYRTKEKLEQMLLEVE
jgi:hypothetical protein